MYLTIVGRLRKFLIVRVEFANWQRDVSNPMLYTMLYLLPVDVRGELFTQSPIAVTAAQEAPKIGTFLVEQYTYSQLSAPCGRLKHTQVTIM